MCAQVFTATFKWDTIVIWSKNTAPKYVLAELMEKIKETGNLNQSRRISRIGVFMFKSTHALSHELGVLELSVAMGQYYGVR